ncbi:MAG: SMP-30/gluconolactonase/LRE family protein [Verrucomicrobia bacterium]|nr:SMP-30/gluconolactonase/LRE family protein [Verrucomicrobiota bacterium]
MRPLSCELLFDARADLGEGPVWHATEERLYWVDIMRGELHAYDPATRRDDVHHVRQPLGFAVPRAAGGFLLGVQRGFAEFDPTNDVLTMIAEPEWPTTGNRFNDGKCDPVGRLFAGTIGEPGTATLWRLDPDRRVHALVRGVTCSNGLAWSGDHRTFYYIDTPTRTIDAFDYEIETGSITNRRTVVQVPESDGVPDGMAIDVEDRLWVCSWGGGRVVCWNPQNGKAVARIDIPAARATSCAFGGPQLAQLYITTARTGASPEELQREPHAGGLFIAEPGVTGAPVAEFAG